jgi:hypothetical protein
VLALAFCAGGRLLASGGGRYAPPRGLWVAETRLWDAATGQEVRSFPDGDELLAVSPGGELLATASNRTQVVLWETGSGKQIGNLRGHRASVICGACTGDGETFVSGSFDTTALVWDVSAARQRARPPVMTVAQSHQFKAEVLNALWDQLASEDTGQGYQALQTLVAAGPRLLSDLDSPEFKVREEAGQQLRRLGDLAGPALRAEQRTPRSPEVRRRVEALLEELRQASLTFSSEKVREQRALEVLERIATPEARQVLEALAEGAPGARLTREARDALERLKRR